MKWSTSLMSKGSPGTCIPGGGVATFLLYAFTAHGVIPADDHRQVRLLCGDAITTHVDLLRGGWREAVPWCRWPVRCRCTRDRPRPGGCPWRGTRVSRRSRTRVRTATSRRKPLRAARRWRTARTQAAATGLARGGRPGEVIGMSCSSGSSPHLLQASHDCQRGG